MTAMMIERHYDDEALIALMESNRFRSDAHLPSCESCSEKLESYQLIADALHDGETWDTRDARDQAVPSTIANLRAFADRMTADDTQAEIYLQDLLAGPREQWMPRLREHPEWRTAGVVRKLVERTPALLVTMPADALELTSLCIDVADHLNANIRDSENLSRLIGAAWRERAFALFYIGEYAQAAAAAERARLAFTDCHLADYEFARLDIVDALINRSLDQTDTALAISRRAAQTFAAYGDHNRYVGSRTAEALALAQAGRHAEALQILLSLEKTFGEDDSSDARSRLLGNIAWAYRQLGETQSAAHYFRLAADAYQVAGGKAEATRVRWNLASMLLESGRVSDAADRLLETRNEFLTLGMTGTAAIVTVELAEARLLQNRVSDVVELCAAAMRQFEESGLAYTRHALTALAYMREAAEKGRATTRLVRHVRQYVRRLPNEPNLLFAPPPVG